MERPAILVANPRDTERTLLSYLLSHEGFSIQQARSASETAEIAQSKPVHLIVLDVAFWQGAETNVLATLRYHPQTRLIPIVLFGESRNREDLAAALQAGAAQWVTRNGFEVPAFLNKLHTLLGQQRCQDTADVNKTQGVSVGQTPASRDMLTAAAISDAFQSSKHLPAFEFSILDTIAATCCKDHTTDNISRVALRDPMLTASLLSAANATVHPHCPSGIVNPTQAIEDLGTRGTYIVAESLPLLDIRNPKTWSPSHFWVHSNATARIAALLSSRLQLGLPADAATAGLLHDVGRAMLATRFARLYQVLLNEAESCDRPSTQWERQLIGLHHGEIAAHAFKQLGVPEMLCDVVLVHHESLAACRALKIATRVIALVVQAADQIANAVFTGDFPLTPLSDFSDECIAAMDSAKISFDDVLREARAIVQELTAEMIRLFPRATADSHYYAQEPIGTLLYFGPGQGESDLIRAFFQARAEEVVQISRLSQHTAPSQAPMVVNLAGITDLSRQVEVLTSIMACGLMRSHRGLVLLPTPPQPVHQTFASDLWRVLSLPAHPALWMPWLAETCHSPVRNDLEPAAA
ncbi:MAG TPA: HDOD domain-containing protein [Phycisphaerae bacterium]|nr:HDOD domain-containing protein [Phycisphaerae bacterium]